MTTAQQNKLVGCISRIFTKMIIFEKGNSKGKKFTMTNKISLLHLIKIINISASIVQIVYTKTINSIFKVGNGIFINKVPMNLSRKRTRLMSDTRNSQKTQIKFRVEQQREPQIPNVFAKYTCIPEVFYFRNTKYGMKYNQKIDEVYYQVGLFL